MHKSRVVNWDTNAMKEQLLQAFIAEQNKRLIDYAKSTILEIGQAVESWHSANHMDRTGNLLNSLCWGVSYNGSLIEGGFYRDAVQHNNGIDGSSTSYLHEWFSGDEKYLEEVNGRQLAQDYLETYGNNGAKGWRVFFAILAPYWGYWEKGFTLIHGGSINPNARKNGRLPRGYKGARGATFTQFAVMTHFYDRIKNDLKPARTRIRVSVRKYDHAKLQKKWAKKAGF